jgi:class 3 adenylate cyclase
MTAADVLWGRAELGATATFCSECGAPEPVGMAQRMESVAPPGAVMLSASTARLVDRETVS